ncbi:hypothetical protein [Neorhizobium sp. T25_13]|uniref:hypothetical protein n=1 Tax=Neorhizobium sp. T25_13 TaxID=2093830 RepID=UPI000CF8C957|nr:hypothetical protein [Neorhizobium sp. T25_13]
MVYLDHLLKARNERSATKVKSPRISNDRRRRHLVNQVMDVLKDWRFSEFENEGPIRHGLRAAMCLEGNAWAFADQEAASVVLEGLNRIGAERPTWEQGQPEFVARDTCAWCRKPLEDDHDRTRKFCSVECAKISIEYLNEDHKYQQSLVGRSAFRLVKRSKSKPLSCEACNKTFQPLYDGHPQRFCSYMCSRAAVRTGGLPERDCQHCGTFFRPRQNRTKFCSTSCAALYNGARPKERFLCTCAWCHRVFGSKNKHARFCSPKHKTDEFRARRKGHPVKDRPSNVIYLTAEMFDGWFKRAA